MAERLPILERFPALGGLPRAKLIGAPTRIDRVTADGHELLVKRDDLCGPAYGGNKVRGLDWLLGDVRAGDEIVTVGARGSTHALTTALCAREIGAHTTVVRWNQYMNDVARRVDVRLRARARVFDAQFVAAAYALAFGVRLMERARWIPAGGATPLAILGHVNAALELAEQIARGECDAPETIVVPLGTGGTAAGLLLGAQVAGLRARIVAVRVVPRIVGRRGRVIALANRTARFIENICHVRVSRVDPTQLSVDHRAFGGAYGQPARLRGDEAGLKAAGVALDDSYSRKAFVVAAALPRRTLFWLTFDARLLQD